MAANGQSWMDTQTIDCASLKNPTQGGCRCEIASCALKLNQHDCVAPFDPSGAQSYTLCDWGPTGCRACPSTTPPSTFIDAGILIHLSVEMMPCLASDYTRFLSGLRDGQGGQPITMELCEEMQEMGVLGTALLPQVFAQLRAPPHPSPTQQPSQAPGI